MKHISNFIALGLGSAVALATVKRSIARLGLVTALSVTATLSWAYDFELSNPGGNADFALAVAISGDTAAVSQANSETPNALQRVVVYRRGTSGWTQEAIIDRRVGNFGSALAISGDRMVIGANYASFREIAYAGLAFVYRRTNGVWTFESQLEGDFTYPDWSRPGFGSTVAIEGNLIVVGASQTAGKGAAFVYKLLSGRWTRVAKLTSPTGQRFGTSVSVSSGRVAVGDPMVTNSNRSESGNATIFTEASGWRALQILKMPTPTTYEQYGQSVCIGGTRLVVGGRWGTGVYEWQNGRFALSTTLQPGPGLWEFHRQENLFGRSVALSGNIIVVSDPGQWSSPVPTDPWNSYAGAIYVYTKTGATWSRRRLGEGITLGDARLGQFVGISGRTVIASAPNARGVGSYFRGRALLYFQ